METAAQGRSGKWSTLDLVYIGVFAVLIAICSWICIPTTVPFTLQTFGVFVTARVLGGKRAAFSVLVYLLLGAIGLPVFAGFTAGAGILLGSTGGYLIGFIFTTLFLWFAEVHFGKGTLVRAVSMVIGLLICYAFGTFWFMRVYGRANGSIGLLTALGWCVFPFIIPDLVKIVLALVIGARVEKYAGI